MCKGACSSLGAVDIAEVLQCMDASIPLFLLSSMLIPWDFRAASRHPGRHRHRRLHVRLLSKCMTTNWADTSSKHTLTAEAVV
jgi:hypothetical protein